MHKISNSPSLHIIQKQRYSLDCIIGESPPIRRLKEDIRKIIQVPQTSVFIQGDTGTGKELIARCIHYNSCKTGEPFIEVNSSAIPEMLLESALFGHERGAFTGTHKSRIGKFEQATDATLFLDEICELPLDLQVKLLLVIQEKQVTRVGGEEEIPVNARIICATNKDPFEEVKAGNVEENKS